MKDPMKYYHGKTNNNDSRIHRILTFYVIIYTPAPLFISTDETLYSFRHGC